MKKQYIDIDQLLKLDLSDQALFIIDANVTHDYLFKSADVQQADLDSWRRDRKPMYLKKDSRFLWDMCHKLNAIRMIQLTTDFINHCFSDFDYNTQTKIYCLTLWHDEDCNTYDAHGEELIDILYELMGKTKKLLSLDGLGKVK